MKQMTMSWLTAILEKFLFVERSERLKVALLSLSFFCIIGSYTVVRVLKDSLFTSLVGGRGAMGTAKLWSMLLLIPAILLFSKLVDVLRKSHLMVFYCLLYAGVGITLGFCVQHPTMGLLNTHQGPERWLGWIIYFFLEGFNPFVVSLFWAFCNSITSPKSAKSNYPLMVAASKLGGVVATTLACWLLKSSTVLDERTLMRDAYNHQILFYVSSFLLLCVPVFIYLLYRWVPAGQLHGYEAAYQADRLKDKREARTGSSWQHSIAQSFEGLVLMTRVPYVMGVFGIAFFWELVNVFINFERVDAAGRAAVTISQKTSLLLEQDFWVHAVGLIITLVGTRALMTKLGERRSLLLMPLATGVLLVLYFISKTESYGSSSAAVAMMTLTYVLMKALNYAFAQPLKESLYIPTTRSVKFKSKSWIDSFGTKFAKAMGSLYAKGAAAPTAVGSGILLGGILTDTIFFSAVIGCWLLAANLLGQRYEQAIRKQEVIGSDV